MICSCHVCVPGLNFGAEPSALPNAPEWNICAMLRATDWVLFCADVWPKPAYLCVSGLEFGQAAYSMTLA